MREENWLGSERTIITRPEDLDSLLNIHITAHNPFNFSCRGSNSLFWSPRAPGMHSECTHMYMQADCPYK